MTVTLRFSFQEPHKINGDLTYKEKTYTFDNEVEKEWFLKGLYEGIGTVYIDFEEVECYES